MSHPGVRMQQPYPEFWVETGGLTRSDYEIGRV